MRLQTSSTALNIIEDERRNIYLCEFSLTDAQATLS